MIMTTAATLRAELEHAQREFELARYIDNTARMQDEQSYWQRRISEIKTRLEELGDE